MTPGPSETPSLTLRQIEVIRAITIAGTVKGAAELLGVSAPGISRVMKHAESQLGIRLFSRVHGHFTPTDKARGIFDQINEVYDRVDKLQKSIEAMKRGAAMRFNFASVPSIARHVLPVAVRKLRARFPDLEMAIDILKIEEAVDYLLLKRGEVVAMSYKLDHPGLMSHPLADGRIMAILPQGHVLADRATITLADLAAEPLIGIEPADPYGRILAGPFIAAGLPFDLSITARFGQTVVALVGQGLGVAVMDEFSLAGLPPRGIVMRPIEGAPRFRTYAVVNADTPRSSQTDALIEALRAAMRESNIGG